MDSNNQVKKQQRGWVQYQNLKLEVETYENYVQKIHFVTEVNNNYNPSPILNKACEQLLEYLLGIRKEFTVFIAPEGSPFQKKVWKAIQSIPYGETRSYKNIAAAIGNPRAARAVGQAANKNPIAIIIPCHRVVGTDGDLRGYAGGIEVKEWLLNLEKEHKDK
ncbi:MAG: methylated-DNA--[protein]-cysteine S-methyltransferase [Candidatus Cloacimonadaceae bacterium]|jgi:methylated-DNA-[protein]-cysteine S-methyltransferase|nr:methylated-DNA--[protein]-cysteine S-methyltransferase [Candidatus Cloacimonadota bacterium]MDY0112498.1 methylated-DNA--[protein]-cysteine S-methyltransferase [Candidatus Syntrophosphaera sp.]